MPSASRRTFLKAASATAAGLALTPSLPAWAAVMTSTTVNVWSTFRDRRHQKSDSLAWKPVTLVDANAIILDPATTKQEILGFGGALTDSTCFILHQLSEAEREPILHDLFAPGEMAMNVCRTCIGASDYSRNVYSFDESPSPIQS